MVLLSSSQDRAQPSTPKLAGTLHVTPWADVAVRVQKKDKGRAQGLRSDSKDDFSHFLKTLAAMTARLRLLKQTGVMTQRGL